jgi:hypothetical protein
MPRAGFEPVIPMFERPKTVLTGQKYSKNKFYVISQEPEDGTSNGQMSPLCKTGTLKGRLKWPLRDTDSPT